MLLPDEPRPPPERPLRGVVGIAAGFLLLLGAIVGAVLLFTIQQPPPVDERGCRLDREFPAVAVILIDQSDPFSPNERKRVRVRVEDWAKTAPRYARISVQRINAEDATRPIEIWYGCSPGRIEGASFEERMNNNAISLQRKWQTHIGAPLEAALGTLETEQNAPYSPIIESIYEILKDPTFANVQGEKRLVVFSDMMQNTRIAGWSVLGGRAVTWSAFKASALGERPVPLVDGLEFETYWMERPGQSAQLARFWSEFADALGAHYTVDGMVPRA